MTKEIDPESNLLAFEAQNLIELQSQLKHSLPRFDDHQLLDQGYVEKGNRVVELQLQQMDLKSLPIILSLL